MDNEKRKGNYKAGPGRPTRAQELGLAKMIDKAWPVAEQQRAITHIASLINDKVTVKINPKTGEEEVSLAVQPKDQINALALLMAYKFGKPLPMKDSDLAPPDDLDLSADIASMTEDERSIYRLRIEQYLARARASGQG